MVQSSDLARISTVQSTDFMGQSSDLAVDLSKSSGRSEEFIYFVWMLVWQWIEVAFYTISPLTDWDLQMVFNWRLNFHEHRSEHRLDLDADLSVSDLFLIFSSIHPSHHEILKFGVKSSDFLLNPWVNPQIAWISLNPWIYQIYLRTFNFSKFSNSLILTFILKFTFSKSKSSEADFWN